jgi:transcriptional regulator with XRE-family HTH domain
MKQFKDILKEKRNALGISQRKLADKTGINHSCIRGWEDGDFFPSFYSLLILADVFKCSLDELVGRTK